MKKILLFSLLFFVVQITFAQTKTITGTVKNKVDGIPIPGVTILIKGTKTSTVTDFDGKYSIKANTNDVLSFSYIGYETKDVKAENAETNVSLSESVQTLNNVTVVGSMGIVRNKSSLGYSVQEVKGKDIADTQRPNFANALQGRVAGLTVTSSTGAPVLLLLYN